MSEPPILRFLGPVTVARGGVPVALPRSQKTYALLAYLAVTRRPQRRDRLASMFWDITDDPRAELRWSLSKLRVLDDAGARRIVSDRQNVTFEPAGAIVDVIEARRACAGGVERLSLEALRELAATFRGSFLEDLDLDGLPEYQAWRVAEREGWRALHATVLGALVSRLEGNPEEALDPARAQVRLTPDDEAARAKLVRLLAAAGRREEAEEHYSLGRRQIQRLGVERGELYSAWREIAIAKAPATTAADVDTARQRVHFCTAPDGARLAWATLGEGPPLVKTANWMSHLEYEWKSPLWRHMARDLSGEFTLVRYDQRGNGLSDWTVEDFSLAACLSDLSTVVDAAKLERFPLLGVSQGCRVAIAWAVAYPDRVSHLILYGGSARGWKRRTPEAFEERAALQVLMRQGWGRDNPAFRQVFTSLFMPDATSEQMAWFNELQRVSSSPENAVALSEANGEADVEELLGQVNVPTLVMHAVDDAVVPFEEGRMLAAQIPGARLVSLPSPNHLLLDDEPAFARFLSEIRAFLRP